MDTLCVVVRRKWAVAQDIVGLELVADAEAELPPFTAGAYIDVHIPRLKYAQSVVRQYSLCNGPTDKDAYVLGIKEDSRSRGGSATIHRDVLEGDKLFIGQPLNNFPLFDSSQKALLFAAGIGITPLLAMAQELAFSQRPFDLHYFARSTEFAAFRDRLSKMEHSGHVHYHYGLTPEATERAVGYAVEAVPSNTHAYCCGPTAFMDVVVAHSQQWIYPQNIHLEYF
jgi:vanillate O-demethylase ferredoxin subunit